MPDPGFTTLPAALHAVITDFSRGRSQRRCRTRQDTLQREFHRRSQVHFRRDRHLLRMQLDDALDDRKAKTCAVAVRRGARSLEAIENPRELLRIDSAPGIADSHANVAILYKHLKANFTMLG